MTELNESNSPSDGWVYSAVYTHKPHTCYPLVTRMVLRYVKQRFKTQENVTCSLQ